MQNKQIGSNTVIEQSLLHWFQNIEPNLGYEAATKLEIRRTV